MKHLPRNWPQAQYGRICRRHGQSAEFGSRCACREPTISFNQLIPADERRQIGFISYVEKGGEDANEEGDEVKQIDVQAAEDRR